MDRINTNTLPTKKVLTLKAARAIGEAALAAAEKKGYNHLVISIASRLHFNLQISFSRGLRQIVFWAEGLTEWSCIAIGVGIRANVG